jgi:hypothetical protein
MEFLQKIKIKNFDKKICYIHVAKCGGTSIRHAIKDQYGSPLQNRLLRRNKNYINLNAGAALRGSEIFNEDLWSYREKLLIYFLSIKSYVFISGHFPFSDLAINHFKDEWNFISILRHPVDRWFSHYFFNRHKKHEHFKTELSLEEYIDSEDGRSLGSFYHRLFYGTCDDKNLSSDESYSKVIGNINKLTCIGLTEHMDKFCRDFTKHFGVKLKIETRNKNPLPKKDRSKLITDSIREKVEEICSPDLKIYNYVLEKIGRK